MRWDNNLYLFSSYYYFVVVAVFVVIVVVLKISKRSQFSLF